MITLYIVHNRVTMLQRRPCTILEEEPWKSIVSLKINHWTPSVKLQNKLRTKLLRSQLRSDLINPRIFCPLHISFTPGKCFWIFEPFDRFSVKSSSQWDGVRIPWLSYTDSRSQLKVMGFTLEFCLQSMSPLTLKGFVFNWDKFSSQYDSVHDPWLHYADSRLRSQLGFTLEFRVCSISLQGIH